MNNILNLINTYPSPYSDLLAVLILFAVFYIIALVVSRLTEQKPEQEETTGDLPDEVPTGDADLEMSDMPESLKKDIEEIEQQEMSEKDTVVDKELPDFSDSGAAQEAFKAPETNETEVAEVTEPQIAAEEVVVEEQLEADTEELPDTSPEGLFSRLRQGLSKTNTGLFGKLEGILSKKEIDMDLWDEFEESLISSDIGVSTTMKLREKIESSLSKRSLTDPSEIKSSLKEEILQILKNAEGEVTKIDHKPTVMIVAGVNGVGKTTTIGKLANRFINDGHKVLVAAGDTFRAAAIEQLEVWSNRVGSDFIKGSPGADPSAVAFDALSASKARGIDLLIIDTAGRLHTKTNLMDELIKIKRVLGREMEDSPHEVLMVLDATTGQNALQQAKTFNEAIDITGIVLTKLDGTAKGGVIIAIADELNIPVKYIGIGESLDDLREFNAEEFVEALFFSTDATLH